MQIVSSQTFVMFQSFKHQIAAFNAVMQYKAYHQPHYPNRVFTMFRKYMFNVH